MAGERGEGVSPLPAQLRGFRAVVQPSFQGKGHLLISP
jgi:hypothetical protein